MLKFNNSHIPPLFANKHEYHKIGCKVIIHPHNNMMKLMETHNRK